MHELSLRFRSECSAIVKRVDEPSSPAKNNSGRCSRTTEEMDVSARQMENLTLDREKDNDDFSKTMDELASQLENWQTSESKDKTKSNRDIHDRFSNGPVVFAQRLR
ncbi:hypothetical protein N7474_009669 [Penicillium riverlandense]|uniref:uncharacterized protein n=1 Tax=Penicillium riverlandense TaxID=1903569 RepID=UPI0025466F7A|nr:uncharacterized protein N7474_009669 [Penicillium riverlandense]KAJ5808400.1 hypothetical protein N7474_009669 [Penicillium riverlandense]